MRVEGSVEPRNHPVTHVPSERVARMVFFLLLGGFVATILFLGREYVATERLMGAIDGIGLEITVLAGPILQTPGVPNSTQARTFDSILRTLTSGVKAFSALSDRNWVEKTGIRLQTMVDRIRTLERRLFVPSPAPGQQWAVRTLSDIIDRATTREILPVLTRLRRREDRLLGEFLWVIALSLPALYAAGKLLSRGPVIVKEPGADAPSVRKTLSGPEEK